MVRDKKIAEKGAGRWTSAFEGDTNGQVAVREYVAKSSSPVFGVEQRQKIRRMEEQGTAKIEEIAAQMEKECLVWTWLTMELKERMKAL
jgi:hypothetical protein